MTDANNVFIVEEITRILLAAETANYVVLSEEPANRVTVPAEDPNRVLVTTIGGQGLRGPGIITGTGEPSATDGAVGDIYIDTTTNEFWGPKESTGWPNAPFYSAGQTLRHVHSQASASNVWTINHALGGYPSVTVVDTASTTVIGEVSYISTSQVRVSFTAPFSGYAYLT